MKYYINIKYIIDKSFYSYLSFVACSFFNNSFGIHFELTKDIKLLKKKAGVTLWCSG